MRQFLAQLQAKALRRPFAHPWRLAEPSPIPVHDGVHQLVHSHGPQQGHPHLGADARDPDQLAKQIPLGAALKAKQGPAILPDGLVHVQRQNTAPRRQADPVTLAHLHLVAHALADQQQAAAARLLPGVLHLSLQPTDHHNPERDPMVPCLPRGIHR